MADNMAFLNQTGAPVLAVMGSLLLMMLILVICAFAVLLRSGKQTEQSPAVLEQGHPDSQQTMNGSGV